MLILFDIDLTLVNTRGAGRDAMVEAGRAVFGKPLNRDGVDFAGRLDPVILRDLIAASGHKATHEAIAAARAAYAELLPGYLEGRSAPLPGALELVDRVNREPGVTIGLLTGNFEETGRLKLEASGFDPDRFAVRVWGDDSPHDPPRREDLPPVGIARYETRHGHLPTETVIVGDTPHDVSCALANACRVLAVATGYTDATTLRAAGAHRVADDLTDTANLAAWLIGE
ncbi:MAG: haloacid dehalogenase-like hydrolase [Phycisphaeraceae bacterium]|nr:MAG: haloacid dehalogenase-like hydrolase [Phycisphaeraceae bacterium]